MTAATIAVAVADPRRGVEGDERDVLETAAALAAARGARLVTVHASVGEASDVEPPRVTELAARWGRTIDHAFLDHRCCDDATNTLLDALRRIDPMLVVAGTRGRSAWTQLVAESVAEGLARNVRVPTLIVPTGSRRLVEPATGALDLQRLLVPAGDAEATAAGLRAARWFAEVAGAAAVEVVLLHVEDGAEAPDVRDVDGLRVVRVSAPGPLEAAVVRAARDADVCAIVMATRGHDGLVDAALGSHTERVLRHARCPLLSVPVA